MRGSARKKSWQRARKSEVVPKDSRWFVGAPLLLKASAGRVITPNMAQRAGPMFRPLADRSGAEADEAGGMYGKALQYLQERGFGRTSLPPTQTHELPSFVKEHYHRLPRSSQQQLEDIHVHPISFCLHLPNAATASQDVTTIVPIVREGSSIGGAEHKELHSKTTIGDEVPRNLEEGMMRQSRDSVSADDNVEPASMQPTRVESEEAGREGANRNESAAGPHQVVYKERLAEKVVDYKAFRAEVCRALFQLKDPGIYTFVDKGHKGLSRRLRAECKPEACSECGVSLWAYCVMDQTGHSTLTLRMRGQHGRLASPKGGRLWTVTEEAIVSSLSNEEMTAKGVKTALQAAGLQLRCQQKQLLDFIGRERAKRQIQRVRAPRLLVGQLASSIARFQVTSFEELSGKAMHELVVLPGTCLEDRVCVVFTCRGMVSRARAAQNKVIKLAVDGKQKIIANDYTILTLSFLVPSETVALTRQARRAVRSKAHTCTQEPFVQALVSAESEDNARQTFETACTLAEQACNLDLKQQVLQLHKDYAKGLEAARKKVFPNSRPCDDYPHMRRASYSALQKHFGVGQKAARAETKRKALFQRLQTIISVSRTLPSIHPVV